MIKLYHALFLINSLLAFKNNKPIRLPMGWMAWGRFMCNTDCQMDSSNCISEKLFLEMIDLIVEKGLKDAGYEYICVDDCWAEKDRDKDYNLVPNHERFPNGIKYLVDYAHLKGLKFGMYMSYGKVTCMGHTPGSQSFLEKDAIYMANLGIDYLKVDGCFTKPDLMDIGYPMLTYFLNKTGHDIVLSYSWPFYQYITNIQPDYRYISKFAHTWRNYYDIAVNWKSVKNIIEHYGAHGAEYGPFHGPSKWFDPDQLVIGNPGISSHHSLTQMVVWSFLSVPLLMSNDLRSLVSENQTLTILKHAGILEIANDPLSSMGLRQYKDDNIEIWLKALTRPKPGSFALMFYNPSPTKFYKAKPHSVTLTSIIGKFCSHAATTTRLPKCNPSGQYRIEKINLPNYYEEFLSGPPSPPRVPDENIVVFDNNVTLLLNPDEIINLYDVTPEGVVLIKLIPY